MAGTYKLYEYDPSISAAMAFAVMFALSTAMHFGQAILKKSWFFAPFVIGGCFELVGYIARYISAKQNPYWETMPYVIQQVLLLVAPSLFAASIYMVLGRIIRLLNGASNSPIRPSWLTKIFVMGDVVSFFMQSGGGGILASAKSDSSRTLGNNVIIGGLIVQVISFSIFITVSVIFHRRMLASPMHMLVKSRIPWSQYMMVLYTGSALILVRSAYRVVEYVQGSNGYLQSKEPFVYIFDASLMILCCILFNIFHPSTILSKLAQTHEDGEDLEMMNDTGYRTI